MARGTVIQADYLVVGAGASGLAFADALVDHAGVRVALVDRRGGVGGHWRGAYPFVRLHQASCFYGVASTVLGGGRLQTEGPEAGLQVRADQPAILGYYAGVLDRLRATGRVELLASCDYADRTVVARGTGRRYEVPPGCRVVDARYLAPDIPAEEPPRFAVEGGARVVPVNDLPAWEGTTSRYVVVGSGKTATDACVRLLTGGVDPGAICWVRPREPWMLNRAKVQPDPAVYLTMVADLLRRAAGATSLDALFGGLEEAGTMLRIDRTVTPTMARAPTLGSWELDLLRTVTDVVRLGHVVAVRPGRLDLEHGSVAVPPDALVVNCAADGLKIRPRIPIWQPEAITVQPVRAGFPCFGAALVGYVEATRTDDAVKNSLCPPSSFGNTLRDWAAMNALGTRAAASFGAEPDIADWSRRVAVNPARVPEDHPGSPALDRALADLRTWSAPGATRLTELSRSGR